MSVEICAGDKGQGVGDAGVGVGEGLGRGSVWMRDWRLSGVSSAVAYAVRVYRRQRHASEKSFMRRGQVIISEQSKLFSIGSLVIRTKDSSSFLFPFLSRLPPVPHPSVLPRPLTPPTS